MISVIHTFLNPILPVFAIMLVGMVCAWRGLFDDAGARAINRFVFYAAVPALLFSLLSNATLGRVDWRLLALYFISELVLFGIGAGVARFGFGRDRAESLLLGMAACFVNHVFFVLPIARFVYGESAVVPITAIIVVDTTLIFAGTIMALEFVTHRGGGGWKLVNLFFRNPVLVSIMLGLLVNTLDCGVPAGIKTFTSFVGAAAAPAALFSLGVILAGTGGLQFDRVAATLTSLKVLLHPLVASLLFGLVAFDPLWQDSALLVAAGPCGSMPFVLALQYNIPATSIGRAIIYSTFASLFTLAVIA